jgi:hypothetical protein
MGNYNCQECVSKEVNIINELLLDTNIFSSDESQIEETKTFESKKKPKKIKQIPSQVDIKKLMENKDLSEDQKRFVEKIINKNSIDLYLKNIEKQEEQKNIIEKQKEQIIAQQKIIEEYKLKQIVFEKNQDKNKTKNNNEEDNIPDVKITTLEPIKYDLQENIEVDTANNAEIIIENSPNSEGEIKNNKNESPQEEDAKIEIKNDENEGTLKSKTFKIDTYEPINENNDNIDYLFEKNDEENEPKDSMRADFRKPIIKKKEKEKDNNINNIKINSQLGPRDSQRIKQTKKNNINKNNNSKINRKKKEIDDNQKHFSPINNTLQIKPMESNNIINKEINNNYESERNAKTLGPYLNEVEEIKNYNTVGNVINGNQNDYEYNLQTSQKDMEITISDKDNPLIFTDVQGNMNYLEKQYEAYKNQMRYGYDD